MIVALQLIVGAVVGVLVGLTGTGGAFVIPALIYLFRMDQLRAQNCASNLLTAHLDHSVHSLLQIAQL